MVTDNRIVNVDDLIKELQKHGLVSSTEDAAAILDFLFLAASILVWNCNEKHNNENS